MTDKVQKIREEVQRIHNLLPVMDGDNISVNYADRICTTLEMYIDSLKEEPDPYIQYASREAGIKAHAEDYSFNIESELFNQLTKEQQALWRKEIEQAVLSGGYCGLNLVNDKRYDKEEPVSDDLEEAAYHNCIDRLSKESIEDFKAGAKWQKEHLWKPADGDKMKDET